MIWALLVVSLIANFVLFLIAGDGYEWTTAHYHMAFEDGYIKGQNDLHIENAPLEIER